MSKVIDITDKLNFDEKPKIKVKGEEFEVNNSARTILKIQSLTKNGVSAENIDKAYELLFSEESKAEIDKLELDIKDFTIFVANAIKIASGVVDEEPEGEAQTPATT